MRKKKRILNEKEKKNRDKVDEKCDSGRLSEKKKRLEGIKKGIGMKTKKLKKVQRR